MNNHRPLTGAERQRLYRQRQRLGLRVFCIELNDADIERLIATGWLEEREGLDDLCIATAIADLVGSLEGARK